VSVVSAGKFFAHVLFLSGDEARMLHAGAGDMPGVA
jgi:hypothetical protein